MFGTKTIRKKVISSNNKNIIIINNGNFYWFEDTENNLQSRRYLVLFNKLLKSNTIYRDIHFEKFKRRKNSFIEKVEKLNG